MAVIRDHINPDNTVQHSNIATFAFFCCITCFTLMLKFGGFKASLNFYNGKKKKEVNNSDAGISLNGAYRTNRDEFFAYSNNVESQRKLTPLPTVSSKSTNEQPMRVAKSTSDLIKTQNLPQNLRQSDPNISQDPRSEQIDDRNDKYQKPRNEKELDAEKRVKKQRQEEQKKLEKQRQEEHRKLQKQQIEDRKKREKLAAQEQARQEKLKKEQEMKEAQQAKKGKKKKALAPTKPLANPLAHGSQQYTTNTLESSISRSSGPPPYNDVPKPDLVKNEADGSGNISFSKPIDTGSWDLISQHRQQINRPVNSTPDRKQMVMDLKYMPDNNLNEPRDNSEV